MEYYLGVDIGSVSSKGIVLDIHGTACAETHRMTGASSLNAANLVKDELLHSLGIPEEQIAFAVSTGYGREIVPYRDTSITEITCHGRGVFSIYPHPQTVIDIGGQDSKAISIDGKGNVNDFVMNDKCAAGTGRFLEVMARALEISLEDMARLTLKSKKEITISNICTVFAESEVVSLIASGASIPDITAGIHRSIAQKTLSLAQRIEISEFVTLTGGVAQNAGVVSAIEKLLGKNVHIPDNPQMTGALGAALLARETACSSG
jgi:predicted CoA-substrate-specific enzyme activase